MKEPTMLYRCPGEHRTDGIDYEYTIVDADEVDTTVAEGWHRSLPEAQAAMKAMEHGPEPSADLRAVHKGRGKYDVVDAEDNVLYTGLTKDEAQAKAGG